MVIGNPNDNDVRVAITEDGITITKQTDLPWKVEQSWEDVSVVEIDTTEQNLFTSDTDEGPFPITIKSGEIKLGDGYSDIDSSLSEYSEGSEQEERSGEEIDYWEHIENETGIRYNKEKNEVQFPKDKQLTRMFSELVNLLFEEDHMSKSDLPWTTKRARTNYVLNTEPRHKDGEEMDGVEAYPGVFFDRKIPRVQRERHVKQLTEEFVEG